MKTVLKPVKFCFWQHVDDAGLMIIEPRTLEPSLRRRQAGAEAWEQQRYFQKEGRTSRKYVRDARASFLLAGLYPCTTQAPSPKSETRNPKPET